MENRNGFRAVIVGGGVVGLTAAHIFSRAGIDFVVLEKHRDAVPAHGTTLALWPQTVRIFDQLGLLEAAQSVLDFVSAEVVLSAEDSRVWHRGTMSELLQLNHGHRLKIAHRPDMVKFLYKSLSDEARSCVLLNKRVTDLEVQEDGVKVSCDDGSVHEGAIVIGADGVRSRVRLLSRAIEAGKRPEDLPRDVQNPYTVTYKLCFGSVPILPGLDSNRRYDAVSDGFCGQMITGSDRAWFGLYEKLDEPTSEHTRYTEADRTAILERRGHFYLAPGWTAKDVHANKIGDTGMIDMEEGLTDRWFSERVVLVGDAVRKLEPHAGLGYNCGVTDLVVLVNGLRTLLQDGRNPSTGDLESVFRAYQDACMPITEKMSEFSERSVRSLAWLTWKDRLMAKYILPYVPISRYMLNNTVAPLVSESPVLEWLEEKALPHAAVPWKCHPLSPER